MKCMSRSLSTICLGCLATFLLTTTAKAIFTEVTEEALGMQPAHIGGSNGVSWPDYNNDGWPDIHISRDVLFKNNGDGTFSLTTGNGLLPPEGTNFLRASWADADNDGDLDCIQGADPHSTPGNPRTSYYFENSGAPDFTFSHHAYYTAPEYTRATMPVFVDTDGDAYCEVYQATFGNWAPEYGRTHDHLFEADGGEVFTDVTGGTIPELLEPAGERHSRSVVACDYDQDFDMDIFVPCYGVDWADPSWENFLWQNDGTGHFTDVATAAGVAIEPHGEYGIGLASGASWGDFDNDGDFDLAVANIHGWLAIYRNEGDGTFVELINGFDEGQTGIWGNRMEWHNTLWADIDNDGDLDLFGSTWYGGPAWLYINEGPENYGRFHYANDEYGLTTSTVFRNIEGFGVADYDRDGDVDLFFAGGSGEYNGKHLFRNDLDELSSEHHWMVVELRGDGVSCGLTAAGAQVSLIYPDGRSGIRQVETTSSDQTMNMHPVHFGLGSREEVAEVEVRWPCGSIEYWNASTWGGLVDQWVTLIEGTGSSMSSAPGIRSEQVSVADPATFTLRAASCGPSTNWIQGVLESGASHSAGRVQLMLLDASGRLLRSTHCQPRAGTDTAFRIEAHDVPAGTYLILARNAEGRSATTKVAVVR